MTKGWYNESHRHSLASKGISSSIDRNNVQTRLPGTEMPNLEVNWNLDSTGFGVFDQSIKHPDNPYRKFDCELVWMSPDEYIEWQYKIIAIDPWAKGRSPKEFFYSGYNPGKAKSIENDINDGKQIDSLVIEIDKDGNPLPFQEGRHRVLVAKKNNIEKIPVWVCRRRE